MDSIRSTRTGSDSSALAVFARRLVAISERAHRRHGFDDVGPFAEQAVELGRAYGWRDGTRRRTRAATAGVSMAAADQFAADPDTATRISDEMWEIWNTAGTPPLPRHPVEINGRDLTHGLGVVAVLGTIAYHDAWHAGHDATSVAVLRALDDLPDPSRHGRTWPRIRTAALDAIQADRVTGPFTAPLTAGRAFVPIRRSDALVAWRGVDEAPTPQHRHEPGATQGRSQ